MPNKPNCFVVRPIHNRSDLVVRLYVDPACRDEFNVIAAGSEINVSTITQGIFNHLNEDSLVVAYLDSPHRVEGEGNKWLWNPNVMLEAGYRMALNKPIVFLREHRVSEEEPLLPFDLADVQVIELPKEQDEKVVTNLDNAISRIKKFVECVKPGKAPYFSPMPAITMAFEGVAGEIRSASEDAAALFGIEPEQSLVGMPLTTVLEKILMRMMPGQRKAFQDEQSRLVGDIEYGRKPIATVCLVFADQNIPPGGKIEGAHLPIVARFGRQEGTTILDVIYLDVTDTARLDQDGVVRCSFGHKQH